MIFDELTEVLDPEPHPAAVNMALDEILLREAKGPLFRVYRWLRPSISFGYFGKVAEAEKAWPGRESVRRWTGGGIVPHGTDVTYTIIAPRSCPFFRVGPLESYARIHEAVASALGSVSAGIALASAAAEKISDACFDNPARHDVLAEGRKVAGAAQRRTQHGLLHQGSIQMAHGDSREMNTAAETIKATLRNALSFSASARPLHACELERAEALAGEKYAREEWPRRF